MFNSFKKELCSQISSGTAVSLLFLSIIDSAEYHKSGSDGSCVMAVDSIMVCEKDLLRSRKLELLLQTKKRLIVTTGKTKAKRRALIILIFLFRAMT